MKINEKTQAMLTVVINQAYEQGFEAGKASVKLIATASTKTLLTANQQRAELIRKARKFVEELKRTGELFGEAWEYREFPFSDGANWKGSGVAYNAEFIVNPNKRTVVALLRGFRSNKVMKRSIAKCHPNEVFNTDIGKAIALARALQIDIPQEFLNTVQPDKVVCGMTLSVGHGSGNLEIKGTAVTELLSGEKILDDTNAKYEEGVACFIQQSIKQ